MKIVNKKTWSIVFQELKSTQADNIVREDLPKQETKWFEIQMLANAPKLDKEDIKDFRKDIRKLDLMKIRSKWDN